MDPAHAVWKHRSEQCRTLGGEGRKAAGVKRYHKSYSLASCFRHIIEQGLGSCLGLHRSILPGTRLLLAHPPRAAAQGETAPKLIDERWNISRCDVRYRAAGVYIQLVRGGGGVAFPGTMASRIRRPARAASTTSECLELTFERSNVEQKYTNGI